MEGGTALALDMRYLKPSALVADIIYAPLETALLTKAKERGHPVLGGLGMLLHQAVRGFTCSGSSRGDERGSNLVAADVQKANRK